MPGTGAGSILPCSTASVCTQLKQQRTLAIDCACHTHLHQLNQHNVELVAHPSNTTATPTYTTQGSGSGGTTPTATAAAAAPSLVFADTAPSWEALESMVKAQMQQHGVDFWADPNAGPTHPLALKRTFGQPESAVRLKLYRDHAAWCPYCQKVWLQLEEKRIPYVIEKINMRCYGDKPASFMAKVGVKAREA